MSIINIKDKAFELFIEERIILEKIKEVAKTINADMEGKNPLFVAILNGSFMFAADLMKEVNIPSEISFVKLASYQGVSSTENVKEIIGLTEDISGRTVVVIEDIVDTGNTMVGIIAQLEKMGAGDVKIATLLFKPNALKKEVKLDYVVMEIPNDFIVGYGLDYSGYGRNLRNIYKVKN